VTLLDRIRELVAEGTVDVSRHGYRELAADDISLEDIIDGLAQAKVVEEYLDYFKVPPVCCFNEIERAAPFMFSGASPKAERTLRSL
jgi:hypothetical protein